MKRLVIAGGVSANKTLRETLKQSFQGKAEVFYPAMEFCTDNGAMIAFASDRSYSQTPERVELMRGNGLPPEDLILHLFVITHLPISS